MKPELARSLARIRVGSFELNLHTGELRSADATVLLREQPFQVLRRVHAVFGEALHEEQMSREVESLDHCASRPPAHTSQRITLSGQCSYNHDCNREAR
jgi:hypothetical protein